MELTHENKGYVVAVANESTSRLAEIANAAVGKLGEFGHATIESFANPNTASGEALQNLSKTMQSVRESNAHLTREPAIARVVVLDHRGQERVYYICRVCQPNCVTAIDVMR